MLSQILYDRFVSRDYRDGDFDELYEYTLNDPECDANEIDIDTSRVNIDKGVIKNEAYVDRANLVSFSFLSGCF